MSEMTDSHLVFLLDVGEEGALVIYPEGEDSMLVRGHEACAVHCTVLSFVGRLQVQAMEGREHSELQLNSILGWYLEWHVTIVIVLGNLNTEDLQGNQLAQINGQASAG